MNFLGGVTRIMRAEGILRGDTDAPTSFSDLQHGATISLAQIAIQDELTELVSDILIGYEKSTAGAVTTVASTRSYALPSDFVRFFGTPMLLQDSFECFEYPGGEDKLHLVYPKYKTDAGTPQWWYFDLTTTKKIAFYPVPTEVKTYTFDYEQSLTPSAASDTLPFHNEMEAQAFCRLAARRFKYLYQEKDVANLISDPEYQKGRATLAALMAGKNPNNIWSPVYK